MKKECLSNANLVSQNAHRFGTGQWSLLVLVLQRSGILSVKIVHKVNGTIWRKGWCWNSQKVDIQFSVLQVHCPEVDSKAKAMENCRCTICADLETIETIFRIIVSVNQLSLYGAVAEMCEEYKTLHDRTEQPVVRGQSSSSLVPSVIKTNVPLDFDDLAHKDLLLQQYGELIAKLSQQDKLSKFCMDAGFLNVVEIGQYFMTKDTAEFSQFTDAVACREYTLPRDEETSQPKGWFQRNTKIGPVLEVATSYLHGKYGVEIRILSVNRDNSHSWVRPSHGLNKIVMNLNNNEQEIPEVRLEECALKLDAKDFAYRSKAKAKLQRRELAGSSPRTIPTGKRFWTDVEPGEYSLSDYDISKKLIHLLRHGNQVHREDDGAVQFWRIKENLQNISRIVLIGLIASGRKAWQEEEETRRDTSTVLILLEWSCISELFKVIQDAILLILLYRTVLLFRATSSSTFIMSDVQSIYIPSSIRDWYLEVKFWTTDRQCSFCLWIRWTKIRRILIRSTWMHRVMHNTCIKAWKKHQTAVYWVDINLALKKGFEVLSDTIERYYPSRNTPSLLYSESCSDGNWRSQKRESIHVTSASTKDPFETWLEKRIGFRRCSTTRRTTNQFQTQVMIERGNPLLEPVEWGNPLLKQVEPKHFHLMESKSLNVEMAHDRKEQPVVETHTDNVPDGSQTRSCHESISFNVGDETIRDRKSQPVGNCDEPSHEQTMLNEVNIDFRIPGLPHSVVKHAESSRVRELVKKIENHPDRHALRQNKANNPFCEESKRMIQEVGNVELFELFETDPKTQCKACLSYWSGGIVYWTCGHLLKKTVANRRFIVLDGFSFNSRIRNQAGKTTWPQIWETPRKQRISSGP